MSELRKHEHVPPSPRRELRFLIVDDNPEGRFLIAKTLLRKFPDSFVLECETAEMAFEVLSKETLSAIISHRTFDMEGIALVRELRKRAPETPLLMTSGLDRREAAVAAGADGFLTYDEWLIVGNRVSDLLDQVSAGRGRPRSN